MIEKFYSTSDAAMLLRLTVRTVRQYIRDGIISAKKYKTLKNGKSTSKRWFIAESEIKRVRGELNKNAEK